MSLLFTLPSLGFVFHVLLVMFRCTLYLADAVKTIMAGGGIYLLVETLAFFFGLSGSVLVIIYKKQDEPYMDEIFHIRQAKHFCDGNISEWDPMITTLPGLYITTLVAILPLEWLFALPMAKTCSVLFLRFINTFYATGNVVLILGIFNLNAQKRQHAAGTQCALAALVLGTLPVLYFFTFLYYTDPGSTFFVLLTYYLSLKQRHLLGAVTSTVAVLFRQTNIVWVAFVAADCALPYVVALVKSKHRAQATAVCDEYEWRFVATTMRTLATKCTLLELSQLLYLVVMNAWCYIVVGVGFVAFVVINGGIVVGAKTDHQAALHFAQIYYFAAFSGVFAFAHLLSRDNVQKFFKFITAHYMLVWILLMVSCFLLWNFSYAHRYLLSDNRHYTFYIWSKILNRHRFVKVVLAPAYLFALWSIDNSLTHKSALWRLVFALLLALNVIPSSLLELRYFIVPYLLWRLNTDIGVSTRRLVAELLFNVIINAVTIYVFLEKTFFWPDDPSPQRFMW